MLEETARVIESGAQHVWVETVRQSACTSCSASKGCGQKLLSDIGQGERFRVMASNPQGLVLNQGDTVVLGLAESSFLSASVLVYLLPLLLMVAIALVADGLALAEPFVAVAALAGLFGGLGAVRRWGPRADSNCRFRPQVLRRTV